MIGPGVLAKADFSPTLGESAHGLRYACMHTHVTHSHMMAQHKRPKTKGKEGFVFIR